MSKPSRGGQRTASMYTNVPPPLNPTTPTNAPAPPKVTPTQVTPPTPQQLARGDVLPAGGVPFKEFEKMTDDQKADVVTKALGVGVPMFLDDSGLQKFAYFTGMSDKPTVVADSQIDKVKGETIYRGIVDAYIGRADIGYSSKDIYKQITDGDYTMFSDSGGSVHGKAIYFGNSFSIANSYAMNKVNYGNGKNPIVIKAKLNGKTVSESTIHNQYRAALSKGDKLALACSNAKNSSAVNLYALAKGYDCIVDNNGYRMVLNRRCLTVSDTYKKAQNGKVSW